MEQGTKEWLEMRKHYIGASDAPVIMGVSPWRTPYQLWQEKLGIGAEQKDNSAMRRGREMESEAREQYQLYTGNFVELSIVFHPTIKYLMASLDGLSVRKDMAVEIKNTGEKDHQTAKEGKVPEKYVPQVQLQLAILELLYNTKLMHYWSYHNGRGVVVEVALDGKYIDKFYVEAKKFWDKVIAFEMPELIEKDLRKRGEEWIEKAKQLAEIKKLLSHYKKISDAQTKELVELSDGQSSMGGNFFFKKAVRPGAVNYKAIPELLNIDLETFRKDPVEMWRLTQKEE